jgi:hypothetical protein
VVAAARFGRFADAHVLDAALLRRMRFLELCGCRLPPAFVPALARLLRGSAVTELSIWNGEVQLLDAPAAALLADALRANAHDAARSKMAALS